LWRSALKRLRAGNDLTIRPDRIKPANRNVQESQPFRPEKEGAGVGRVKSREQLITELADLRKQIAEMQRSETD